MQAQPVYIKCYADIICKAGYKFCTNQSYTASVELGKLQHVMVVALLPLFRLTLSQIIMKYPNM
jgi:hypothetical protein